MPEPIISGTSALATQEDPQAQALRTEANEMLAAARSVKVDTADDYARAGKFFASIKTKIKEIETERRRRVDPLNATVKIINADFKAITDQLEMVLKVIEAPMLNFKREEERIRREAEEAARKERERIELEARERAAEEARKAEEARRAQEQALQAAQQAANPVAAYVAQEQARQAEEAAQAASAAAQDAIREAGTVDRLVPVVAPPKATAAGTSFRKTWKAEVVDPLLIPREYLMPNEQLLGQIAREQKENAPNIPGVRFYAVESIGGR